MYTEIRKQWLAAILDVYRDMANKIIDEWVNLHGYEAILTHILEPVLEDLGNLWTRQGDVSFAQVYVSATIAEDTISKVLSQKTLTTMTKKTDTIILGNIEDDFHSLGRRLVSTFLLSSGWNVIDMGNDVTAEEFVDMAVETNTRIIMVSAMMYTTAKNIIKVREEIDKRGLTGKILLAVGGAVFNLREDLWEKVGADATAKNAVETVNLAKQLITRLNNKEGVS